MIISYDIKILWLCMVNAKATPFDALRGGRCEAMTLKFEGAYGVSFYVYGYTRRRRSPAQRAGMRRHLSHSAGPGWTRQECLPLAHRTAQAQAAEACRRGAGEQSRAHRMEADDQRRNLQSRCTAADPGAHCIEIGQIRGAIYPYRAELVPELAREQQVV